MEEIKAIETEYNGYRFRSRLEARWAVFFDSLDIDYEYEPEGFVLEDGSKYLPDFYLPTHELYVEVKSKNNVFIKPMEYGMEFHSDKTKYAYASKYFVEHKSGLWFVFGDPVDALFTKDHCGGGKNYIFMKCLCLGKYLLSIDQDYICECNGEEVIASNCKSSGIHDICTNVVAFHKNFILVDSESSVPIFVNAMPITIWHDVLKGIKKEYQLKECGKKTFESAKKARQARFEHGEKPII